MMFRAHSTFFGFVTAAAALGIAGIASAWSWNPIVYIFAAFIVFVLAARIIAGFAPVSFGGDDDKRIGQGTDDPDDGDVLQRYSETRPPGMRVSNNQLLASAFAEAQQGDMTGDAMKRFAKIATLVDEDERGDPHP